MPTHARTAKETLWNADTLRACTGAQANAGSFVVAANRAPVRCERGASGGRIERRGSGGLVTALEPLMAASGGVWVALDDAPPDRAPADDAVWTTAAGYRIRGVRLGQQQQRGYYDGFANEGLWPLCHHVHVRPVFRAQDFADYRSANARFADAVCDEARSPTPLVLVQDYHLALVPKMIRNRRPQSRIVSFWHVPFPPPQQFAICPWARQLVEGLLGSSIAGFQTADDCRHFMDTVESLVDADVDRTCGVVTYRDQPTRVRAYPASIDWPRAGARAPSAAASRAVVQARFALPDDVQLVVGIDRLDYTKGLEEKLLVLERLLDWRRELRGRLVLLQVASPSRAGLPAYQAMRTSLRNTAARINERFGAPGYQPVILVEQTIEPHDVDRLLRAADVCYVGSLHDGMNLVAKEFVAARDDERGVLMLSQFTGAARELRSAVIVNPYDIDTSARALARALRMAPAEQGEAMRRMRDVVAEWSAYRWAGEMIVDAAAVQPEPEPEPIEV